MKKGQVKIIGGQWRGRKLSFPTIPGLRPTPNRIRETLFNWLNPILIGADCLDLFAGSGALGFEALSRGAKSATFIEQSPILTHYLKAQIEQLAAVPKAKVYHATYPFRASRLFEATPPPAFNLIFLDPPFFKNLIELACTWLLQENLLLPETIIYMETESPVSALTLPKNWKISHSKKSGRVNYGLAKITH